MTHIDPEYLSNLSARINLRTNSRDLPATSRSPIFGRLMHLYAELAMTKGVDTTPEDAHAAWLKWLESQGGRLERPELDCVSEFDRRVAAGIVDAARYNHAQK